MSLCLGRAGSRSDKTRSFACQKRETHRLFALCVGQGRRDGGLCLGRHGAGLEYAAMRTPGLGRHREWPAAAFAAASAPFSVQSTCRWARQRAQRATGVELGNGRRAATSHRIFDVWRPFSSGRSGVWASETLAFTRELEAGSAEVENRKAAMDRSNGCQNNARKSETEGGRWFQAALEEPWEKSLTLCCGKVLVLDLDLENLEGRSASTSAVR